MPVNKILKYTQVQLIHFVIIIKINLMEYLSVVAKGLSNKAAQPVACLYAICIILIWGLLGIPLHFNDTWQLIINTLAAIISIIMLFIIQNSQNRHTIAIQLKLDEIIRATQGAHNEMMDIEKLADEDLAKIQKRYGSLSEKTKKDLKNGKLDTHTGDIDLP
ncbi:MAG: low affinity iron permease family protein [Candidatus Omnitrophica bacterium]|nr:low affinity iron permease family protein [Candidatus Omnitrophota bacterium]